MSAKTSEARALAEFAAANADAFQEAARKLERDVLSAALAAARGPGAGVFPCHGTDLNGGCLCGDPNCGAPGKHPVYGGGFHGATKDEDAVRAMWADYPLANPGINPGADLVTFDLDRKGGKDGLREFAKYLGLKPIALLDGTRCVATPTSGYHVTYKNTSGHTFSTGTGLLQGVDFRSAEGHVMAPGARIGLAKYHFVTKVRPVPIPDRAVDLLLSAGATAKPRRDPADRRLLVEEEDAEENQEAFIEYLNRHADRWDLEGRFSEGRRNETVAKLIGPLGWDFGLSEETTADLAADWYEQRADCDFDVDYHMRSGYRRASGDFGSRTKEGMRLIREELEEERRREAEAFKEFITEQE